jgi:hypothetical protein
MSGRACRIRAARGGLRLSIEQPDAAKGGTENLEEPRLVRGGRGVDVRVIGDGALSDYSILSRGFRASRTPSPRVLTVITVMKMARPGKLGYHQASKMNARP